MRRVHQFGFIAIFQHLLDHAPLAIGRGSYKDATALFSPVVQIELFAFLYLGEPALAQTTSGNIAINPETKFYGTPAAYHINRIRLLFEALGFDAVKAVFQKLVDFMAVPDEIEMTLSRSKVRSALREPFCACGTAGSIL